MGRAVSLVMAIAAVLGVFVEIPIISDYAFWILVAASLSGTVFTAWKGQDLEKMERRSILGRD
jgi:hypothetical protein